MKIGLVCPYNITKGGGVQECVKALQAGLEARGHAALIITPSPRKKAYGMKNTIFLGGMADFRSPMSTTTQIAVSADGNEIDEILAREKFDVLHFHEPWQPILSRQILSRSKSVNIATFHAKLPETMMSRTVARVVTPYTKSVLKYIHEYTAVSEAAMEYLRTMTDVPVSIIPNGIDLHHYHAPRRYPTKNEKTILFVGRLEKRKGIDYLLKAYKELCKVQDNVKLVIAGDGVDREKLELKVEEMQLKNVKFLGYVSETRKRALMHDADIFCSPALYGESFGIVLLEAMASGLVTVAGNNPGYSAVLQGLGSVSLVNPRHTDDFVKRMLLLMNESEMRKLWRSWARSALPQYDYEAVVAQYEAVYKAACERHGNVK